MCDNEGCLSAVAEVFLSFFACRSAGKMQSCNDPFLHDVREVAMTKKLCFPSVCTVLLLGLPLLGASMSGRPVALFVSFPPLTQSVAHAAFSWPAFSGCLAVALGVIGLAATVGRRPLRFVPECSGRRLPWWGWIAFGLLAACWVLAWTRMPWFAPWQRHTFLPLWLGYVVAINALCHRQSGTCPMLERPLAFVGLFPLSAVFWWYFEYLNQFTQNWYYVGVAYGAWQYSLHATLSFATVLPAVLTTRVWISQQRWFRRRLHGLRPLRPSRPRIAALVILGLGCLGLAGLGFSPEVLFPMLWISPVMIVCSLQALAGREHIFCAVEGGDWRPVVSAALAALFCGFFWEMWNFYSLARWVYSVPYVGGCKLFAMPILGYLGYLPFGLACIAVIGLFDGDALRG